MRERETHYSQRKEKVMTVRLRAMGFCGLDIAELPLYTLLSFFNLKMLKKQQLVPGPVMTNPMAAGISACAANKVRPFRSVLS